MAPTNNDKAMITRILKLRLFFGQMVLNNDFNINDSLFSLLLLPLLLVVSLSCIGGFTLGGGFSNVLGVVFEVEVEVEVDFNDDDDEVDLKLEVDLLVKYLILDILIDLEIGKLKGIGDINLTGDGFINLTFLINIYDIVCVCVCWLVSNWVGLILNSNKGGGGVWL